MSRRADGDLSGAADAAVFADAVDRLRVLLPQTDHVIRFDDYGWIIAHPIRERLYGDLFDCEVRWDDSDPDVRGRFVLNDDGTLGPEVGE